MEPTQENRDIGKFTDVELDKLLNDLIELEKTEAVLDFQNNAFMENDISEVAHDHSVSHKDGSINMRFLGGVEESTQVMIQEMTERWQQYQFIQGKFSGFIQPIMVNASDFGSLYHAGESSSEMYSFVNRGNLVSSQEAVSESPCGDCSRRFACGDRLAVSSLVRYFHCNQSNSRKELPNSPKRKKRKCKGIVETEEETAKRLECSKIKNREAASKAHEKKLAREAYLINQLHKQRKKNAFLRNLLMFLEGYKRVDVTLQPLRRTISGPL